MRLHVTVNCVQVRERVREQNYKRERDAVKALEMNFEILDRENESASAMGKNYI